MKMQREWLRRLSDIVSAIEPLIIRLILLALLLFGAANFIKETVVK
jgi:hypothetical protein